MIKLMLMQGHVLDCLRRIPDEGVDCVITSPPYWGLRKYPDSANIVWDGDSNCEHDWGEKIKISSGQIAGFYCKKCGAWFGQLGLEPTLELYLKHLFQVFKELKRVLKPTGVIFINMGSNYSSGKAKVVVKEWYE